jgi:hypothetical protein
MKLEIYISRAKEINGARPFFYLMERRGMMLVDMTKPLAVDLCFILRLQRKGIEIHDADYFLHKSITEN